MDPVHAQYNIMDSALRAWDDMVENREIYNLNTWDLDTFLDRVFLGWNTLVYLRDDTRVGVVVEREGLLVVLPIYWLERLPTDDDDEGLLPGADLDEDNFYNRPTYRTRGQKESAFDNALSDSIFGTDQMALIEGLVTEENSDGLPHPVSEVRPSILLAVEALILSAPAADQDAMRMLVALHGHALPTGYHRLR